jgi:iron complex outermembrane recepter protein
MAILSRITHEGLTAHLLFSLVAAGFMYLSINAQVSADTPPAHDFQIAPQALASALVEFSKQADVQVLGATDVIRTLRTSGVVGHFTEEQALEQLLRGTELSFRWTAQRTITISPRAIVPVGSTHVSSADPASLSAQAASSPAAEQISPQAGPSQSHDLDEIIVTGSRQSGLKASDSPAPVQILSAEALKAASGNPDLMSTLAQIVPSLTQQAFGLDMAQQTLQVKMRGLSPNHVLVLVNGKRRHTTANLAIDLGSVFQGGAGVDLNFIPVDAIDHIEVLTDGAAAQYGSDAIAGVINIILKKSSSGGSVTGTYGQNAGSVGGKTEDASANAGFEPTDRSYFNITGEFYNRGHTSANSVDNRVVNPANLATYPDSNMPLVPGYPYLNHYGDTGARQMKLVFINMGDDLENGIELYSTISYGHKDAASYENYRLPHYADYTDATTGQPVYPLPFGFDPLQSTAEDDYQYNAGVRGMLASWNWDLNMGYGGDKVAFSTIDSDNSGYSQATGQPSPQNFYDGYLQATQWTTTLDINRDFDVGLAGPLNVAYGGEYRRDTYSIGAGSYASWVDGGPASYAGFTPNDAGSHGRRSYAGYIDLAGKIVDGLRIDAAGRFEHYSDFGDATVGKLTARYDFTPEFALRGTVSNGFRAPTLAEEYYTATDLGPTTAYVQLAPNSPAAKYLGLGTGLQPEHSVNLSLGAVWRPTPGMSATLDVYQITVTNRIVGSGQILGSNGGVIVSPTVNDAIVASRAPLNPEIVATGVTGLNIFANGIDTRTRGADLVFDFPVEYDFGKIAWSIGATYNVTTITKYAATPPQLASVNPATGIPTNELYDATAYSDLTTGNPRFVINLGALYTYDKLAINLVEKIYGASSEYENDDADNGGTGPGTVPACTPQRGTLFICPGGFDYFQSRIGVQPITNLDVSYQLKEHVKLSIGALNLFNKFPPRLNAELLKHMDSFAYGDGNGVEQYPQFSPFGITGGFYYVKAGVTF